MGLFFQFDARGGFVYDLAGFVRASPIPCFGWVRLCSQVRRDPRSAGCRNRKRFEFPTFNGFVLALSIFLTPLQNADGAHPDAAPSC